MATPSSAFMSSGSKSPATGFYEAIQMGDDSRKSPMREAHLRSDSPLLSPSSSDGREHPADAEYLDDELISSTSRLSRLPNKVPSSPQTSNTSLIPAAIPAYQNNLTSNTSQDVHHFVNSSASLPTSTVNLSGLTSSPETTVSSSFTQPLHHHVLTHPIRRPRTSANIFQSSTDLASHYGIPQILPPAPKITPRTTPPTVSKPSSPVVPDFRTLSSNYLNMLNNTSTDSVPRPSATVMSTAAPMGLDAPNPILETQILELEEIIGKRTVIHHWIITTHMEASSKAASPEFRDHGAFSDYLNTPVVPELDHFDTSPLDPDWSDFLTTPLFKDGEDLIQVDYSNEPLFPPLPSYDNYTFHVESEVPVVPKAADPVDPFANLHTISPNTPALDSFDSFVSAVPAARAVHVPFTSPDMSSSTTPAMAATAATSRRVKATGIRKGITPESLLDETAPTQPRKYTTPSATSRKEIPAVFARKRSRSTAFGEEEEDQLDTLPPNPTEKDLIEQKRRQNTVAARRSRKRKLEQFQMLEKSLKEETKLKEVWKERANVLMQMLRDRNIPIPDWPTDEQTLQDEMDI